MFTLSPTLKNLNSVVVYHIVKSTDKYNLDEGYIGVTNDLERRRTQHFEALKLNEHKNIHLQNYYKKHNDNVVMYVYKTFPLSKERYAYQLEEFLRPKVNVGLNIAVGGKKPYNEIFNVKQYSESSYVNSKSKNIFSAFKDGLKIFDKKLATIAHEALEKTKHEQKMSEKKLDIWKKQKEGEQNQRILQHLNRTKLNHNDLAAIEDWKNQIKKND